jgi:hypothetical protein
MFNTLGNSFPGGPMGCISWLSNRPRPVNLGFLVSLLIESKSILLCFIAIYPTNGLPFSILLPPDLQNLP